MEVDVDPLVARSVGVRDIRRQRLMALAGALDGALEGKLRGVEEHWDGISLEEIGGPSLDPTSPVRGAASRLIGWRRSTLRPGRHRARSTAQSAAPARRVRRRRNRRRRRGPAGGRRARAWSACARTRAWRQLPLDDGQRLQRQASAGGRRAERGGEPDALSRRGRELVPAALGGQRALGVRQREDFGPGSIRRRRPEPRRRAARQELGHLLDLLGLLFHAGLEQCREQKT